MAGSHRAERSRQPRPGSGRPTRKKLPPRLSKRAVAGAAAIALLPALWLGAQRVIGDDDPATGPNDTAIPDVTTTRSPTAAPSAPATPAAPTTSEAPGPTLIRVPASPPRRLTVAGLLDVGFDDSIEVRNGGFIAGSTAEAARWGSRGVPASPGTDTVYLIGKVYRDGASAFDALPSVKVGAKIVVRTQRGSVLTYTVQSAAAVPANGMLTTPTFAEKKAGRLVLVGILFDANDDQRTGKYQVVVAQLTGARRA